MSVFTILERLAPHVEREVNLILNSKQEAQTLKSKLERINEGLQDAERHGVTDNNVKHWLGQLEDVMNEMDDALDQWETKNIELQIEQMELDKLVDLWHKVPSLLLSVCSSLKHVVGRRMLVQEFIALSGRLDEILEERGKYSFVSVDGSSLQLDRQESTSSVDKSKTYGRKSDTDSLVDLLLSSSKNDCPLIVSVVGIEGLGKTTLAQLVFNDDIVDKHFGRLKAWVSVPDPFDPLLVARGILATFDRSLTGDSPLEILGQRIKAIVSGRNFLLVLDNVRRVDRAKWESLMNFLVGQTGFKILVTTTDAISARTIGTTYSPHLSLLSDSDCAKILTTIALKETEGEEQKEFLEIGFDIAKKCNGLPLAAKTVGHALESRTKIKEWRDLLESPLWMYEDEMSDMLRPLRLSYMELSPLLKRCFLSSVLYSKGFKFDSEGMIRIWTAQGYLESSSDWDRIVSKGEKYLKSLSEKSFFQVSGSNNEGSLTYRMHDILFDFAINLSRSEYYVIVDGRTDKRPYRVATGGRIRYFCARFVSQKDLPRNLFRLLNRARVLCLSDCDFEEFSEDLGKLVHLRYLDLSGNHMKYLPENVTNLYNLQTLDLRRCRNLIKLPNGLEKMIKLRHLLISDTDNLLELDEELSKLSGLWTLDKCAATRDSLVYSDQLQNSAPKDSFTCLSLLGFVRASKQNRAEMICNEDELVVAEPCAVSVDWNDLRDDEGMLKHIAVIKEEVAESSAGKPQDWNRDLDSKLPPIKMATKYLNNVRTLEINGSEYPRLPQLESLRMLVTLHIQKVDFRALTLEFFVGGFPKLETLTFSECGLWEEWDDLEEAEEVIMPCLNYLAITLCPNLKALPHKLLRAVASLQELFVAGSPHLAAAYNKEMRGSDWDKISQIPNTIILADY